MDVEKLVREYIDKTIHMSLATVAEGKPWVCEVHFAYDEDLNIYYRSLASRRHSQEIDANPNVAGDIIDKYDLDDPVVGLYFEGRAEKLEHSREQQKAFDVIKARLQVGDEVLMEAQQPDGHQFYKVSVENFYIFGRFDGPSGKKYQLPWPKEDLS